MRIHAITMLGAALAAVAAFAAVALAAAGAPAPAARLDAREGPCET